MPEIGIPLKSYSKSELYQELKSRKLVILSYRAFIDWVYDDPLAKELEERPELKRKKVLQPRYIKLIISAIL